MFVSSPIASRRGYAFTVCVAAILALAVGLRVYSLGGRSLWTDEYLSLECSAGWGRSDLLVAASHSAAPDLISLNHAKPWTDIWGSIAADENHPPLYFLILRAWRTAFGDSAVALRSLSVVTSVAAVGLMIAAGTEAFGPTAGLCAGLLMAVAAPQLREAQDARAYMPVTAVAVWALLMLLRIDRRGPNLWRVIGLSLALLVLPLLHYMALSTVGVVAVYAAVWMRGAGRRAVLVATGAAVTIYGACWGPHMFGQHRRMLDATQWLVEPAAGHFGRTVADLLAAPIRLLIDAKPAIAVTGGCMALLVPPLVIWVGRQRVANRQSVATSDSPPAINGRLLLPWLWLVVPVAVAGVIDAAVSRHSLSMAKYTLAGAPGLYLIFGAVASTGRRFAWVPAAAVALGCLAFLPDVYHPVEPDWRELARAVDARTRPTDPVVLIAPAHTGPAVDEASGMRVVSLEYCLARANGGMRDVYVVDGPPAGATLAALQRANHACVIGSYLEPATNRLLSGLAIDRSEVFSGMGVVGTADRPAATTVALSK